jgi:hypothetical protein
VGVQIKYLSQNMYSSQVKPQENPKEYHVMFVDSNGTHHEYAKTNVKAIYDKVNVSKNYTVTVENGYIKTIDGVPV